MIQFLKELWKVLRRSTPDKAEITTISPDEQVSRFIYQKSDWSKQGVPKPKPKVYLPMREAGHLETSVCRISGAREGRIWDIANQARAPKFALARADLIIRSIELVGLSTKPAPNIEEDYPEHAVIVGWPDEKDTQMELAVQLACSATLVIAPRPA